ncbi:hypothetical protein PVAND_008830 [Polypedilum vanderplanki]|uniref:Coiled-coil domain-containing protein 102A n=1 Tax=Polypedilum vanderplanki TaxID=319348 RepID=A0A9J6CB12_POLVA|nr:hypothetical protein PVAND_008830 [Polypedilum vanderplanki]
MNQNEWEIRETQRLRELEEYKGRAAQMEKTMKWWSECTNNWREKWAKVRNERNQARDEAKQLRVQLELCMKESNGYKREKHDLEIQVQQLKKEMEKIHHSLMQHASTHKEPERISNSPDQFSNDGLKNVNSEDGLVTKARSLSENESNSESKNIEDYANQGAMPKETRANISDMNEKQLIEKLKSSKSEDADDDSEYLIQRAMMLQLRLDDANKAINLEKDEKIQLIKALDKLRHELDDTRNKCEELRSARQEAVRELLTIQETHRAELRIINNSLQEETGTRESLERRLSELRSELERLQAENSSYWSRLERTETEKINLERENKKIKAELIDGQVSGRLPSWSSGNGSRSEEFRMMQQELIEKTKEIQELRHSQSKMKKMLSEANVELGHAVRRAEQYETEVKRLRTRIEELKKELTMAEDEIDAASSAIRRLQRNNEDLNVRHSSPKHYSSSSRGTNSPRVVQEYRPNINDLKKIFDETKHSLHSKKSSSSYSDAKPSYMIQDEIIFDGKNRSEFERVKQKFDRSQSAKGANLCSNSKNKFQSKSFEARNDINQKTRNISVDDYDFRSNILPQQYDCEPSSSKRSTFHNQASHEKQENTIDLTASFNLDGFKVSEDDDDDDTP